jgi:IPT/TIG domain
MTENIDFQSDDPAIDEKKLRRYVLGQSSPQDAHEIEELALGNNNVLDLLSAIEDELADEYATGELNEVEKAFFERRLLLTRGQRLNLRLSQLLLNRQNETSFENTFGAEGLSNPLDGFFGEMQKHPMPHEAKLSVGRSGWVAAWVAACFAAVFISLQFFPQQKATSVVSTIPNPVPAIASLSTHWNDPGRLASFVETPKDLARRTVIGFLTITGTNFVQGAVVRLNGSNCPTAFVDPSTIVAVILAARFSPGETKIVVVNPPPGGGSSSEMRIILNDDR